MYRTAVVKLAILTYSAAILHGVTCIAQPWTLVCEVYPWLASGVLTYARLTELPEGVLIRAADLTITETQLQDQINSATAQLRSQLRANAFFLLEQLATKGLLVSLAKADGQTEPNDSALIEQYLRRIIRDVNVTDQDIIRFYNDNKDAIGGVSLELVRDQIRQMLLEQRQQAMVQEHIRTMGQRMAIGVSRAWGGAQAQLAMDNSVDKARASGRPSLVDFGSTNCIPCQMLAPILETLRKKYEGRLNVLLVHAGENQILAARFRVEAIPTLIFFDSKGREVFRHVGFWPQDQIEASLAQIGIR